MEPYNTGVKSTTCMYAHGLEEEEEEEEER